MIVLTLDGPLLPHMVRALAEHRDWCRRNGITPPAELDALLDALAARNGQQRPTDDVQRAVVKPVLMSYEAAATRLGVSPRTVRRMTADGRLPIVAVGGRRLVPVEALDEYGRRAA